MHVTDKEATQNHPPPKKNSHIKKGATYIHDSPEILPLEVSWDQETRDNQSRRHRCLMTFLLLTGLCQMSRH